jgi:hypothetical protein
MERQSVNQPPIRRDHGDKVTEILRPYEPLLPLVPTALLVASLAGAALAAIRYRRGVSLHWSVRTAVLDVGLGLWSLIIMIATLPRAGTGTRSVELVPFGELSYGVESTVIARMVGNILLFLPIGILVPKRWAWADSLAGIALLGCSISLSVELIQFLIATGRQTSVTDVLLNATGATLGYLIISLSRRNRLRSDR